MQKMIITAGIILAVIAMITTIPATKAYVIDATANNNNDLYNIKITPESNEKPLTEATIINSYTGNAPTLSVYGNSVGLIATATYKANATETRLYPISVQPDVRTIERHPESITYNLGGPYGYYKVNLLPSGAVNDGILHLEGISIHP